MSKLKLYQHTEQSRQELHEDIYDSVKQLDGISQTLQSELYEWSYENETQVALNQQDPLAKQLAWVDDFSKKLDQAYVAKGLIDAKSRAERDLIKYRLRCKIESNAIINIEIEKGDKIHKLVDVPRDISWVEPLRLENQFKTYMEYNSHTPGKVISSSEDITKLHNENRDIYINLAPTLGVSADIENSKTLKEIKKQFPSVSQEAKQGTKIGKSSWSERLKDLLRKIKKIFTKDPEVKDAKTVPTTADAVPVPTKVYYEKSPVPYYTALRSLNDQGGIPPRPPMTAPLPSIPGIKLENATNVQPSSIGNVKTTLPYRTR